MKPAEKHTCAGSCAACSHGAGSGRNVDDSGFSGWSFAARSMLVFLLPIAAGITGALIAGDVGNRSSVGAFAGLLAGMIVTLGLRRYLFGRHKRK